MRQSTNGTTSNNGIGRWEIMGRVWNEVDGDDKVVAK